MRRLVIITLFLVSASVMVQAQDFVTIFSGQHQFDVQFEKMTQKYEFETYKGSVKSWQKKFRADLKDILGLTELEKQYKGFVPKVEQIDCEDLGYATRERWRIWTEPTMIIPFIIVRPKGELKNAPLFIATQGHDDNPELYSGVYRDEEERVYIYDEGRDLALQAAKRGYIAINPTTRGFGQTLHEESIRKKYGDSCKYYMLRGVMVGRTIIGDRVWDVMRLIDWALENLPIDKDKIVVCGNSGGGTMALYSAAVDQRIALSSPSCCFSTFEASIGAMSHCPCNYIPDIMSLCNMGDIAGLIAPRKLLIVNGVKDDIYPIGPARDEFRTVQNVYNALRAGENCEMYEGAEGHRPYMPGFWDFCARKF